MTQARKRCPAASRRPGRGRARPAANPAAAARTPGPLDARLDPALFRALSDPTRAALVACIAKCARGCAVSEIADCCRVDLSVVSRHLGTLARAGVLVAERRGRTVLYRVRTDELAAALRALADALEACAIAEAGCTDASGCCSGSGCRPEHVCVAPPLVRRHPLRAPKDTP